MSYIPVDYEVMKIRSKLNKEDFPGYNEKDSDQTRHYALLLASEKKIEKMIKLRKKLIVLMNLNAINNPLYSKIYGKDVDWLEKIIVEFK